MDSGCSLRERALVMLFVALGAGACSNGVPLGPSNAATAKTVSSGSTSAPTPAAAPASTPPTPANVAYTPDLQPIFSSDCVACHGTRSPAARYSMTTYAGVMAAVSPGNASSPLVIVTQPGGLMYSFFSGDRASKAAMVKAWVLSGARESR